MCTYCTPQSCSRQKWVPEGLGISQPSPKDPQICLSQLCKSVGTHGKRQGWTDVGGAALRHMEYRLALPKDHTQNEVLLQYF